ncbi:GNAT family N-acetyltransferase [Clostridium thermarum]|uniref:GNAT family N-acetyltransferase n=1 Tax=Clostridium thermarum TaxID=1716543 RepID=UPI00111D6173|nr:GNAT family N-acetyltransferase [Clostridium thermarum]
MSGGVLAIRKAVLADVPSIQKITREAFEAYVACAGIPGSTAALTESVEDIEVDIETKHCFVAELDGVIVGSVRIEIREDNTAYLSRFGVAVNYQNHGIGASLLDYVDDVMRELGVSRIYLHTASKILSLVRFYYGRGFYIDSTTKDRGYIRALLCKEYNENCYSENSSYGTFAV